MTEKFLITCLINLLFLPLMLHSQWIKMTDFAGKQFSDLHFINADTGFLAGGKYEDPDLCRTYDGGLTLEEVYLDFNYNLNSVFFLNADTGYVAGEFKNPPFMNDTGAVILKTINSGLEWAVDSLPGMGKDVYFINPDTG